jgi:hypothetical protein
MSGCFGQKKTLSRMFCCSSKSLTSFTFTLILIHLLFFHWKMNIE